MINPDDEEFLRNWYKGITGDEYFEDRYRTFMGADSSGEAPPGSNRRILADFIGAGKKQALAAYALQLYSHQASGDRARDEFTLSSYALVAALLIAGVTLLATRNPSLVGAVLMGAGLAFYVVLRIFWWRSEKREGG